MFSRAGVNTQKHGPRPRTAVLPGDTSCVDSSGFGNKTWPPAKPVAAISCRVHDYDLQDVDAIAREGLRLEGC
jgi:hypothetical protein